MGAIEGLIFLGKIAGTIICSWLTGAAILDLLNWKWHTVRYRLFAIIFGSASAYAIYLMWGG